LKCGKHRIIYRKTERQKDRKKERQKDRKTRQKYRKTERQKDRNIFIGYQLLSYKSNLVADLFPSNGGQQSKKNTQVWILH
jgi:hypothetical protein